MLLSLKYGQSAARKKARTYPLKPTVPTFRQFGFVLFEPPFTSVKETSSVPALLVSYKLLGFFFPVPSGRLLNYRRSRAPRLWHPDPPIPLWQTDGSLSQFPLPVHLHSLKECNSLFTTQFPTNPSRSLTSHQQVDRLLGWVAYIVGGCAVVVAGVPGLY